MPDRLVDLGVHPVPTTLDPMEPIATCPKCGRVLARLARSVLGTGIERRQREAAEGLAAFCPCVGKPR